MQFTRDQLLSLLSEACEIEHALACAYLYAAFSLKQSPESDLDWRDQQIIRRWAGQIYFVASQEMLHLAQAWNLLSAIGGTPYFMRPSFPQSKSYWPLPAALTLQGFSIKTIERFMYWEAPIESHIRKDYVKRKHESTDFDLSFHSVGQLYDLIADGIDSIPESRLFLADPTLQIGGDLAEFPDLIRVIDKASALEAVKQVQHQGEGIKTDREDSHFGIFYEMRHQLIERIKENSSFDPAHLVLENPTVRKRIGANYVVAPATREVMAMFSDIYVFAMRLLGWVFGPGSPASHQARAFAKVGINAMPVILKPLGEALARMPSGDGQHNAGAGFNLQRHVPLATDANLALLLVEERIDELTQAADRLRQRPDLNEDLNWLPAQLAWLKKQLHHRQNDNH